jgi:hypothetical protein
MSLYYLRILPENTRKMLERMSNRNKYNGNYQAQPKRNRKRSEMKFAKMKDGLKKKQMADMVMGPVYATPGHNMALYSDGVEQPVVKNGNTCIFWGSPGTKLEERRSASTLVGPKRKWRLKWLA